MPGGKCEAADSGQVTAGYLCFNESHNVNPVLHHLHGDEVRAANVGKCKDVPGGYVK